MSVVPHKVTNVIVLVKYILYFHECGGTQSYKSTRGAFMHSIFISSSSLFWTFSS